MEILDDFYNDGTLGGQLEKELDWTIVGSTRDEESIVHSILSEIINKHKNGKVGVILGLEGGIAVDYIHADFKEEWRFILGFTELGYWAYCNTPKTKLVQFKDTKTSIFTSLTTSQLHESSTYENNWFDR